MGAHARETRERLQRQEQRRKVIRNTAVVVGLSVLALAGAAKIKDSGSDGLPKPVAEAEKAYVDIYGCKQIGKIAIATGDFNQHVASIDPTSKILAKTNKHNITLHPSLSVEGKANMVKHELTHACIETEPRMFAKRYQVEPSTYATGAAGFVVWFSDSTPEKPNTFNDIDEGVAEWIAEGVPGFVASTDRGYSSVRKLTSVLAGAADLNRKQLSDMHQNSDLLGYVSAVNHTSVDKISDSQLADFIFLYQDALTTGYIPTSEELAGQYHIQAA